MRKLSGQEQVDILNEIYDIVNIKNAQYKFCSDNNGYKPDFDIIITFKNNIEKMNIDKLLPYGLVSIEINKINIILMDYDDYSKKIKNIESNGNLKRKLEKYKQLQKICKFKNL